MQRPTRSGLDAALAEAGGVAAPREASARLRALLDEELRDGARELEQPRSGYDAPVVVALAPYGDGLAAVAPVARELRADPAAATERGWLVVAALIGAIVEVADPPQLLAGALGEHLALVAPRGAAHAELAALAYEEHTAGVDRLRTRALALPAPVLEDVGDLREPIGDAHPIRVAAVVARLGGRPADPESVAALEEAALEALAVDAGGVQRPHDDPVAARRVARRILQRLHGMGKWGGYHTEFSHLARGFAGNDRALAEEVGEALLRAGLLSEKRSVGQRHVFLNPRRAGDIHRLIDDGEAPADLRLP